MRGRIRTDGSSDDERKTDVKRRLCRICLPVMIILLAACLSGCGGPGAKGRVYWLNFKSEMDGTLRLVRNPDILKSVHGPRVRIGFAAETGLPDAEAARKCREKGLDLVVGNDVTRSDSGFGTATNRVTFVTPDGRVQHLPLMSKLAVARRIVAFAERITSHG